MSATKLAPKKIMAHVFTTGQIAQITNVAPRTVTKWIDGKKIKGHRLPGSTDRRVYQSDLITFMVENELSLDNLKTFLQVRGCSMSGLEQCAVFVGFDLHSQDRFRETIADHDMHFTRGVFDAAVLILKHVPPLIVVDVSNGMCEATTLAKSVRSHDGHERTTLIAVGGEDGLGTLELTLAGYDAVLFRPLDFDLIASSIATGTVKSKGGA